jgi:hypothetical protein
MQEEPLQQTDIGGEQGESPAGGFGAKLKEKLGDSRLGWALLIVLLTILLVLSIRYAAFLLGRAGGGTQTVEIGGDLKPLEEGQYTLYFTAGSKQGYTTASSTFTVTTKTAGDGEPAAGGEEAPPPKPKPKPTKVVLKAKKFLLVGNRWTKFVRMRVKRKGKKVPVVQLAAGGDLAKTSFRIPKNGCYGVRALIQYDDPPPVIGTFKIDGTRVKRFALTKGDRKFRWKHLGRVALKRGRHRIDVRFENDFFNPLFRPLEAFNRDLRFERIVFRRIGGMKKCPKVAGKGESKAEIIKALPSVFRQVWGRNASRRVLRAWEREISKGGIVSTQALRDKIMYWKLRGCLLRGCR